MIFCPSVSATTLLSHPCTLLYPNHLVKLSLPNIYFIVGDYSVTENVTMEIKNGLTITGINCTIQGITSNTQQKSPALVFASGNSSTLTVGSELKLENVIFKDINIVSENVAAATAQTRPSNGVIVPGLGGSQWGKINSSQTATIVVIKQSLGSWSHLWILSNVSGCGSTSLFGSRAGTHQISDQSRALEDRNDSNNSLEVYTPNSFIHLFYNSPYMDVVDMHNVIITPSDSVLLEKTMEASYLVGSFPCQFNFISVFDIPVWDEFWEQATSRHFCPFR